MKKQIVEDKDFLHQKSKRIDMCSYAEEKRIKTILHDMKDTIAMSPKAIGLAAPQIGELDRIFIFLRYPSYKRQVVINPEILEKLGKPENLNEECLSCPGQTIENIPRFKKIRVKYTNEDGLSIIETLTGIDAVVYQHELDHLDGIIITDYLPS